MLVEQEIQNCVAFWEPKTYKNKILKKCKKPIQQLFPTDSKLGKTNLKLV